MLSDHCGCTDNNLDASASRRGRIILVMISQLHKKFMKHFLVSERSNRV